MGYWSSQDELGGNSQEEGGSRNPPALQSIKNMTITCCKKVTCNELIASKLPYPGAIIKAMEREAVGTLLCCMQTIKTMNITFSNNKACNQLIASELPYSKAVIKKKDREGPGTLLYSMRMNKILNVTQELAITYGGIIIGKLSPGMSWSSSTSGSRESSTTT